MWNIIARTYRRMELLLLLFNSHIFQIWSCYIIGNCFVYVSMYLRLRKSGIYSKWNNCSIRRVQYNIRHICQRQLFTRLWTWYVTDYVSGKWRMAKCVLSPTRYNAHWNIMVMYNNKLIKSAVCIQFCIMIMYCKCKLF